MIFHSDRSRGTFGTRAGSLSSWWKGENSATVDIVNWRMALNIKEFWKLFLMLLLFLQLLFLLLLLLFLLLFTNRTGKRKSLGKSFLAVKQKISKECYVPIPVPYYLGAFEAKIEAGAGLKWRLWLQPNIPAPDSSGYETLIRSSIICTWLQLQ